MARNLDPKCKQCRRAGEKLFLKGERCYSPKCAMIKRKYPPGVHGPKQRIRLSEYGLQLREKQKMRKQYGLLERQFKNYFVKASKMKGDIGYNFLNLLESRLDNVVLKSGIVESRNLARQMISHGHILVNEKKVTIPSYVAKVGDLVAIKEKSSFADRMKDMEKSKKEKENLPSWISFDKDNKAVKVVSSIDEEDLPKGIDTRLVIEYYSK